MNANDIYQKLMLDKTDQSEVLQDLLFLYELSLTIGKSLDLGKNAESFLKGLVSQGQADMAAVWFSEKVKKFRDPEPDDSLFVYKVEPPRYFHQEGGEMGDYIKSRLVGNNNVSFHQENDYFLGGQILPAGHYALFSLGALGILMLYKASVDSTRYMATKIWQMESIIEKLKVSLEGSLAHRNNDREVAIRREAEARLKENQIQLNRAMERFNLAVNGSNGGIWDRDLQSGRTIFSQNWLTLLGYENHPLPYRWESFVELIHPKDRPEVVRIMDEHARSNKEQFDIEYRMRHHSGKYVWVKTRGSVVQDLHNNAVRMVGILWDVTRERRISSELIEARRNAEEALAIKSRFLSTMSHEIRTPMNAVIGLANILYMDNKDPAQASNVESLKYSAEYLMNVVNDILDYNSIESGEIKLVYEPISLHEILAHVVEVLKHQVNSEAVNLVLNIDGEVPKTLIGDAGRLSQILTNLVDNAIKFTQSGEVVLTARVTSRFEDSILVYFEVMDTGIGIEPEKLEAIFDRFTQADSSITRKFGGTGLGLAITRKLLEMQNSQIGVESSPGVGSRFFFELAFATPGENTVPGAVREAGFEDLDGASILLVEDNSVNIMVARKFLRKWNLKVAVARNGVEALDKISTNHFDLILMDLSMPEMDGYSASKAIRKLEDPYYRQVPIIALSANIMTEVQGDIEKAGMNDFVAKPFNPRELHAKIRGFLKKNEG